jgi:hypothetical protein
MLLIEQFQSNVRSKVKDYKQKLNNPKLTGKEIRLRLGFLERITEGNLSLEDWFTCFDPGKSIEEKRWQHQAITRIRRTTRLS